jgi:pilus assembly protein FimV
MAIRPDSDPKSASSRSGSPKGELEQYGVWVKAEPQDVIEEAGVPDTGDFDFDLPVESTSLPDESFLSEDEEKLLGSFDSDFEAVSGTASTDKSGLLPDIEDMPPLEESLLASEPSRSDEEIGDFESAGLDISLEDMPGAQEPSSIHPGAELDMDSIQGFDSPEASTKTGDGIEDISSDFLEMPADVTSEFLDIDMRFEDSEVEAPVASGSGGADAGFEPVTEFDDFLSADEPKAQAAPAVTSRDFDDISAVERDLSSPAPSLEASPEDRGERHDLSTELLKKIAEELSSIRGELVTLRSRIGEIVAPAEPPAAKAAEELSLPGEESGPSGGFFDEEEDETIALTGDELDNILNTADFTEETAETEQLLELESETLLPDMPFAEDTPLLDESLLPETGDYSTTAPEPAIEEVRLGQPDSIDEVGQEARPSEAEDLSLFVEEGVAHLTPAPEDTSFLEGPESLGLGLPLNDEPLVEPDLSEFDLEAEELESSPEIEEELPLASLEPEIEDVTLGIEAGPDYASEDSVMEAELLEPIPEIEETSFADINLHEEAKAEISLSEASDMEEIDFLPESDLGAAPESGQALEEEEDLVLATETEGKPAPRPAPRPAPEKAREAPMAEAAPSPKGDDGDRLKSEIKSVLSYLDKLLDSLPEEKIEEFARSEYFDTYKKLFEELGLV